MLHFPNAKINLGLFVTEKRQDGYHNIETVFYPLRMMKDALEVLPAAEDSDSAMRISGKKIEGDIYENLVWKAYQLIKEDFPEQATNINIHLMKTIPMGAGLGGGSSDGAFMLHLLNKFYNLELSDESLAVLALKLGSDCPFFIYNTPQFASGRGELLEPSAVDLGLYSVQLICPKIHVSTADAFAKIEAQPAAFGLKNLAELPVEQWKDVVFNDFEKTVFELHPALARIKQQLYNEGAVYAAMSGSGSAVYGIFNEGEKSTLASNDVQEVFYFE